MLQELPNQKPSNERILNVTLCLQVLGWEVSNVNEREYFCCMDGGEHKDIGKQWLSQL